VPWPALGQTTTAGAILNQIVTVIEALSPIVVATPFRHHRAEGAADFLKWAEEKAASSFRRFFVRHEPTGGAPAISNTDFEEKTATFHVIVSYPQASARTGVSSGGEALTRDNVIDRDFTQINYAIGMDGRSNFIPPNPDACWDNRSPGRLPRLVGKACDFLQLKLMYRYHRSTTA